MQNILRFQVSWICELTMHKTTQIIAKSKKKKNNLLVSKTYYKTNLQSWWASVLLWKVTETSLEKSEFERTNLSRIYYILKNNLIEGQCISQVSWICPCTQHPFGASAVYVKTIWKGSCFLSWLFWSCPKERRP